MKTEIPDVSIIIPLYNRRYLIEETLLSVRNQNYLNWEAIVVDDGSDDGSYEFAEELQKEDPRIRVYKREATRPKGAPSCRNIGIEKSTGKFIIFLDSDDLLAPYCLEQRLKYMTDHPDLDFAIFYIILFNKVPGDSRILWNIFKGDDDIYRFLNSDSPWQTTSPIWKREFIHRIGKWDEEALSWQDWEFHIRSLALKPKYSKVDWIPDCFMRRDNHERISKADKSFDHYTSRVILFQKILFLLRQEGILTEEYKKLLAAYFFKVQEKALLKGLNISSNIFFYPAYQRNLVSKSTYLLAVTFFFSIRFIRFHYYTRMWKRYLLPGFLFHKNASGKKVKLDPVKFEQLKSRAKLKI